MFAGTLRTAAEQLGRRIAFSCMNGGTSRFIGIPARRGPPNRVSSNEEKYRFDEARLRAVERWRPRVAVVCARRSIYGDPGPALLEHLGQGASPCVWWSSLRTSLPQDNVPKVEAGRNHLCEIASRHPHCRILPTADLYARGEQVPVLDGRKVLSLDDHHLTSAGAQLALPRMVASLAELLE